MYTFRILFLILGSSILLTTVSCEKIKTELLKQTKFPLCKSCKIFVESFKKAMDKTSKGKFEGGDAAWEEEKLGSYSQSEVRLVETQELVCADVEEGKDQCYTFNEQYDSIIEDWWFNYQLKEENLFQFLCIDNIKVCCPDLHYGPNCLPCLGYPDQVCSNNGKCKGSGTRKGNGKCSCDTEYDGEKCDQCASNYYESYRDNNKLLCSKCHVSCEGNCAKEGPTGCANCANGWIMDKEKGCLDVNECATIKPVCNPLQFCVNSEGSYRCLECDNSCLGCTGDGPDMCIACANGFTLIENVCVDSEQEQRRQHVFLTRYLTYLGLCIATCIIFQRNVLLAAIIGLAVGIYISVSEYMLNTPPVPNATDFAQTLGGQGYKRCHCKGGCKNKKCTCRARKQTCNSKCHGSLSCQNKN